MIKVFSLTGTAQVLHNKQWTKKGFSTRVRSVDVETDIMTKLMMKLETTTFKKTVKDIVIESKKDLGEPYKIKQL